MAGKTIGENLLKEGMITEAQLKQALEIEEQREKPLCGILVELNYLSEEELAGYFVEKYGCPYLPLANYEINPEGIKIIPEAVARKHLLFPVDKIGNLLTVATINPLEEKVAEAIKELTGCKVVSYVSTISAIKEAINTYYGEFEQEKKQ